ncbi:serine/arginine repetitive matrix protein 2-like [Zootoca vivipara]|uniref:serine/arginine repetitive matrix protein 2-like n=1 Tax=Zootoca vivipara TaxID=8524 RepID=UPI00293C0FD3|nr:serine/arginine repetitive matrix protein 2-like [Zootoca vivipara]
MNERQLRVKMANGRKYYLQLCAPAGQEDIIFQRWLRLIYVLNVANGRISDPISFTSKQSGLHTIWKSASFRATPEKHWLQIVMAEEDSNEMVKEQLREANLVKSTSRSMESVPAAKRTIRKSGVAGRSAQETRGIPAREGHTSRSPPATSAPRSPTSVAAGPRGVGAKAAASNPSRQLSWHDRMTSGELATLAAPSKFGSRNRSSPSRSQTAGVKSPKPSRPQTPLSPSPEQGRPPSQSPSSKGRPPSQSPSPKGRPPSQSPSSKGRPPSQSPSPKGRPPSQSPSPKGRPPSQSPSPKEKKPSLQLRTDVKSPKPSRPQTPLSPSPEQGLPPSQSPSPKEKEPSLQLHTDVKSPEPSRPQTPLSSSAEQERPTSQSPPLEEKEPSLQLRRTKASLAVGPSDQGWDNADVRPSKAGGQMSRPQSKALETEKQSRDLAKQIQSRSATGKPHRSNKSMSKLGKALSSVRQRSSPTFITIYSVLSSSLERLKGKGDYKHWTSPGELTCVLRAAGAGSGRTVRKGSGEGLAATKPELSLLTMAGTGALMLLLQPPSSRLSAEAGRSQEEGGRKKAPLYARAGTARTIRSTLIHTVIPG